MQILVSQCVRKIYILIRSYLLYFAITKARILLWVQHTLYYTWNMCNQIYRISNYMIWNHLDIIYIYIHICMELTYIIRYAQWAAHWGDILCQGACQMYGHEWIRLCGAWRLAHDWRPQHHEFLVQWGQDTYTSSDTERVLAKVQAIWWTMGAGSSRWGDGGHSANWSVWWQCESWYKLRHRTYHGVLCECDPLASLFSSHVPIPVVQFLNPVWRVKPSMPFYVG